MANALQSRPISVAVDATTWSDYIAGIFSGEGCGPYHNHAVLIVGMTDDYWHVKNSWGIHLFSRSHHDMIGKKKAPTTVGASLSHQWDSNP